MKTYTGAKVNLSLAVTGKCRGLHTLDMRVCTVSLCDSAELAEGEGRRFVWKKTREGFDPERFEPVLERAYARLAEHFGGSPRFVLEKDIPSGAGLGGSSALIACMARLWAMVSGREPDDGLLLSLGSDVPYMYRGGEARVTGRGEKVASLPFVPREVLIALPRCGVDTAAAYALYDGMKEAGELSERRGEHFNDLFAPAVRLAPEVGRAADALRAAGARDVVMTGSGSAVCAFFDSAEELARVRARAEGEFDCIPAHTLPGN